MPLFSGFWTPSPAPDPAPPTGIDYLALVRDRHTAALREPPVNYAGLAQSTTKTVGNVGRAFADRPEYACQP
jgi:capsid portal protein